MEPEGLITPNLPSVAAASQGSPIAAVAAAALGMFAVTLDAVVVNVALPSIRQDLGGGIAGLQWIVDGYTLTFAAFLLSAGSLSDRLGSRRSFGIGVALFVVASVGCGLAPNLVALIVARLAQGAAAAVMMPSSMAVIAQAFPEPARRARSVAAWAMGGAVASSSGPVIGGLLTLASWRLIFLINLPVGLLIVFLLICAGRPTATQRRKVPFDWVGQVTAILAMGSIIYATIEAGSVGIQAPQVLATLAVGVAAFGGFVLAQARGRHPMIPHELVHSRTVSIASAVGFAFMVGFYGLPFVMSLYLQEGRGLTALETGLVFLPMMIIGLIVTPFTAWLIERIGARRLVTTGLIVMATGLASVALAPAQTPVWVLSTIMVVVGLSGPLIMPPMTSLLLGNVAGHVSGTASGVFNTSRQIGGGLAVAVFGALLAERSEFNSGVAASLSTAAAVALIAATASRFLPTGNESAIGRHTQAAAPPS
ncbi:MFS transporter [Arthrobacter sp. M4]|uniref:MFS transporter n=1 Tax=Arthrobacter sp. M4 TaxID=218160 RepID=UPI001CDC8AAA|nr:MFS transporter [Arthrobacter sp. M4]MCA4135403.1 MFS transporter [Arthrobacter sp. M4]